MADFEFFLREQARLKADRALHEARWNNIARLVYPDTASFTADPAPGATNRYEILDNTAEDAADMAAAGLHGLLTNPATQIFTFSLFDPDLAERDDNARWLEMATRRVTNLFAYAPSKFNVATHDCYREAIPFANWCMFINERPGELPLFQAVPLREIVVDEDDDGSIVRVFRDFKRPLWAIHRKFKGQLPKRLAKLYDQKDNWHKRIRVIHAVEPRELYDPKVLNARNKPFRSCWIDAEGQEEIKEGGYDEMPYVFGRWPGLPGEIYGRGCGDKALPDTALLQRGTEGMIKAVELVGRPPMLAPDQGLVKRLNLRPAAVNYVRADVLAQKAEPKPLLTGARTDMTEEFLAGVRDRIKRAFMRDLLQLIRDPEATATQVLELKEEQMRGMSPILARVTQDWLGPLVMRTFGCAQRAGAFRDMPVPESLVGQVPRPVFVSPAARAQQLAEGRGIAQAFEASAPLLQLDPDVVDNTDLDKAYRLIYRVLGTPLSIMRSPEQVAARRQQRLAVAEQKQTEESLKNVSTAVKNVSPALKIMSEQQQAQAA